MQVTNEIREAFLFAVQNLKPQDQMIEIAFEAKETEDLMVWLTLQEKVAFGKKLLELCPNIVEPSWNKSDRNLQTDLTEDR